MTVLVLELGREPSPHSGSREAEAENPAWQALVLGLAQWVALGKIFWRVGRWS
jgi:hypothetical protein